MVKKADIILCVAVAAVMGAVIILFSLFAGNGKTVVITANGNSRETKLSVDNTVNITDSVLGSNTVVIKGGTVYVSEADCRDQICVNHAPISKEGEIIVCLPHKVTVEIR